MTAELIVTSGRLKAFIHEAMTRLGLPDTDAAVVADLMTQADLQGSDGHGVSRLPQYGRRIKAGGFNTRLDIRVVREQASTALVPPLDRSCIAFDWLRCRNPDRESRNKKPTHVRFSSNT
jgi:hypothetical protein